MVVSNIRQEVKIYINCKRCFSSKFRNIYLAEVTTEGASVRLDDIVFQTYLATAEESDTASEELSSQDEMLKGKADAFVRK